MSVVENGSTQMLMNGTWQVDPALSAVEFRVRHLMIATVKGCFREFGGAIVPGEVRSDLDRTDFGLSWNRPLETGGVLFGNAVELALDVSAVRVD
jgi:polyisoprenoid-binding protein YceI